MARKATAKAAKRRPGRPWPNVDRTSKAQRMTARAFASWLEAQGLTDSDAARLLGTSPSTIARYREKGGPALLGLACAAVSKGLASWKD
jgi:transposase